MLDYVIIEARRQPQNEVVLTKRIARNQRFSVGRTDSADLVLNDDPEISSIHFLVAVSDEDCTIIDQNSTNKTWYNGQSITQINIGDGESIRCGKTDFVFRLVSTSDNPFAAKPIVRDLFRAGNGFDTAPIPNPPVDTTPGAGRSSNVKPVQPPPPPQMPPAKPAPPAIPKPVASKPSPPVKPAPRNPDPAPATESGDVINWNLFVEEKPDAGQIVEAIVPAKGAVSQSDTDAQTPFAPSAERLDRQDKKAGEAEKTRVIDGGKPVGTVVKVVMGIAGNSDPSSCLVMDPHQNSKVLIGRGSSSHLSCPPDPFMSNRHFEIEVRSNLCLVRDLKSANGTSLNGQRILIAPLCHGDRIRAGKTDFDISIEARE